MPRASAPVRSYAAAYAGPPFAAMVSASSCTVSGAPSALLVSPQARAPSTTEQMSWSSASCTRIRSGLCSESTI